MPNFQFIEEGHRYLVDGNQWLSVTQVLPWSYYKDNGEAMLRGTYVHRMIELYNNNDLDEESLDPALKGFLDAYKQFKKDFGLNSKFYANI